MEMDRRKFLSLTSAAGVGLLAAVPPRSRGAGSETEKQYKYRLAFDVWLNDVRTEAMPLANWPMKTFQPAPAARSANPSDAVVLPFPSPV